MTSPSWYSIASVTLFLTLWHGLAHALQTPLLPGPLQVLEALIRETVHGELLHHLGITLARLAVSFVLAMTIGTTLGILLGRAPLLDRVVDPWLVLFLNVPALVTIILCYVWLGMGEVAAICAVVVNKVPNVAVSLREGARSLDRDLLDMARAFRFGRWKTLRHVVWPQLYPFLAAASRTGIALIWKIILVVEVLGRSDGMGFQLHLFFQLFDVTSILAYTLAFVFVVQALELLVMRPLDAHALRWRR